MDGNDLAGSLKAVINPDAAFTAPFVGVHGRRRNLDFVSMANDTLVVSDFISVLLAGFLGAKIYGHFLETDALVLEFWRPLYLVVGVGAIISPALLRDRSLTSVSRFRRGVACSAAL